VGIKKHVREIKVEEIVEAVCDKCEKNLPIEFDHDGSSTLLDGKDMTYSGGFRSKHDLTIIECILCEDCIFDVLMPYGKIKNYWYED